MTYFSFVLKNGALYYDYRMAIIAENLSVNQVPISLSRTFSPNPIPISSSVSAFSCIFSFICWIYLWHSLVLCECSEDVVDKVTPKNTLFCIYLRNCLLLFLLLSVFYHKIYVLNVIAGAKSHVNFISFVFPFVLRFFMAFIPSFSFGSSFCVSECVCTRAHPVKGGRNNNIQPDTLRLVQIQS